MSNPSHSSHREQPGTYFVQNRHDKEELIRLHIQDQLMTDSMGGVLPEQADPASFQRVLDAGCGTGDWLIMVAKAYPSISLLIGIDISKRTVNYAQAQAEAEGVSDRVEFHIMDALRGLDFADDYFDLVNQRFGMGWVRTWNWPELLQEYQRVTRLGGVIRITESDVEEGPYPALAQLGRLFIQAFYQAGHFFTAESGGMINHLARLLPQYAGIRDVQTRLHTLEYRVGTPGWQGLHEHSRRLYQTALPFLRKWTRVPENYEEIFQQAMNEQKQMDFVGSWHVLTV
jgi:ubiquinone/menaquinone biosynthesis C-methylase UbiE